MSILKTTVNIQTKKDIFEKFVAEMKKIEKKPHVRVGVQSAGEKGENADASKLIRLRDGTIGETEAVTLVQVAVYQEFGTEHIPPRSFLRATYQEKKNEWGQFADMLMTKIIMGELDTHKALGLLGTKMQSDIRAHFVDNDWKALKSDKGRATGKGNSTYQTHRPLIDTGQLRRGITYKRMMNGSDGND